MNAQLVWRIILSFVAGAIVIGMCLCLVVDDDSTYYIRYSQISTVHSIKDIAKSIDAFQKKKGVLPSSLTRIHPESSAPFSTPFLKGTFRDGWDNPLIYQRQNQKYRLISLGRDGKRGGVGLDCDLSSDNLHPSQARLTPWEIFVHPLMRGMIDAALICGLCAGVFTFCTLNYEAMERGLWVGVIWPFLIVLLMSTFVSMLIAIVHVPSGGGH